mgnify:CR=1 FL=1
MMGQAIGRPAIKGVLLGSAVDSLVDAEVMLSALEPSSDALVTQAHDLIIRALAAARQSLDLDERADK